MGTFAETAIANFRFHFSFAANKQKLSFSVYIDTAAYK
jgi:hypothetical protein